MGYHNVSFMEIFTTPVLTDVSIRREEVKNCNISGADTIYSAYKNDNKYLCLLIIKQPLRSKGT